MKRYLPFFNYRVTNNANSGICDVYIDGDIVDASTEKFMKEWWDDDTATSFRTVRETIDKAGAKTVNVYINSGGGQVVEAMAIHDYLVSIKNKGVKVNTYGRGLIASAATYILMAGNENSTISENSWFMIHNVSGWAYGSVDEIEKQAGILRKFNDTIRDYYSNHTGIDSQTIEQMMEDETWLTGVEAKEKGFVKNLEKPQTFEKEIKNEQWMFNNTEVLAAYNSNVFTNQNKLDNAMFEKLEEAFKNVLVKAGVIKNEATPENQAENTESVSQEAVLNALREELGSVKSAIDQSIQDAVSNALSEKSKGFVSSEAVENIQKELGTLKTELDQIKDDVTNNAGSPAKPANSSRDLQDGGKYEHKGISFE